MRAAALVPARMGSKGIPGKNFRLLNGKPLVKWTIEAAVESAIFEKIIFSSDGGWSLIDSKSPEGLDTVKQYNGILTIDDDRPPELSTDDARLDDLLLYYAKKFPEIEVWCLLQPTSPMRTAQDIRKAYRTIQAQKWDSLVSVTQDPMMFWVENATSRGHACLYHYHKRPNRQQRNSFFRENGAIYFTKTPLLIYTACRIGGNIALFKMPKERSYEIDDETDWRICETLMGGAKCLP